MNRRFITAIVVLIVLLPSVLVQTQTQKSLSPFVPVPFIKAGFFNSVFYKEGQRESYSIWNYQNIFNRNSRIVDTDFNEIKQTPDLNGLYYFDGKKYVEHIYLPSDRAPDTTSLLKMDGTQYYIPNGWSVFPLENVCAIRKSNSVEFYHLDNVTPLANFDIESPSSLPIVFGNGRFAIVMYKYGTKLLDLRSGKEICDIKSNLWWDAGNSIFATPSFIINLETGESFDISDQGLDPLTPLIIKKDYVEFYVDLDTHSQGRKMKDYPMIVRIGFDGKLIENISLDFILAGSVFKILRSSGSMVLVQNFESNLYMLKSLAAYDSYTGQKLWEQKLSDYEFYMGQVEIINKDSPKLIISSSETTFRIDFKSGVIEKRINKREPFIETKVVFEGNRFWFGRHDSGFIDGDSKVVSVNQSNDVSTFELPFKISKPLLDSSNGRIYLVSRKNIDEMSTLLVDTATIDAKTGKVAKGMSFSVEDASDQAVSLDCKFMFVFGQIKQTIFDLESGKKVILDDAISSACNLMVGKFAGGKVYVLTGFANKKNILTVFDSNLSQISKTSLTGSYTDVLAANDRYVVAADHFGSIMVFDCNGNHLELKCTFIMLENDDLVYRGKTDGKIYKMNLETRQPKLMGESIISSQVVDSYGGTLFDGRNSYDENFDCLQRGLRVRKIYETQNKTFASFDNYYGVIAQLKPTPSYSLSRTDTGSFLITNIRNDGLTDDLSGYAVAFTMPTLKIDMPIKLENKVEFKSLKPGQSQTLKYDLGDTDGKCAILAVFSNGFYHTDARNKNYRYVGVKLSESEPELLYLGGWPAQNQP